MRKNRFFVLGVLALGLAFAGCDNGTTTDDSGDFVPVTSITGVPTSGVKNTVVTLTRTVNPATATNKTITWSVKNADYTGATIIDGNKLNTATSGNSTVTVTATIVNGLTESSNYTQDFYIYLTINSGGTFPVEYQGTWHSTTNSDELVISSDEVNYRSGSVGGIWHSLGSIYSVGNGHMIQMTPSFKLRSDSYYINISGGTLSIGLDGSGIAENYDTWIPTSTYTK
jgi:hypothetical protein